MPTASLPAWDAAPSSTAGPASHATRRAVLVANTAWYLLNFRGPLIRRMLADGIEVVAVSPSDRFVPDLEALGVRHIDWDVDRRGRSPLDEIRSVRTLQAIYQAERPAIAHHFTIKPVLYGTHAARRCGVPKIVNSMTGLGHLFVSPSLSTRLIRPGVRRWLTRSLTGPDVRAVFQSAADFAEIARDCPELASRAAIVCGSGVDLDRFAPVADRVRARAAAATADRPFRVLFVGRLIGEKGIVEFVEAARLLHSRNRHGRNLPVELVACGEVDLGNPSAIDDRTLAAWRDEGLVSFPGHLADMPAAFAAADAIVLPSYREGTSRVLLEAAASGLPAIASDVPGCNDVVVDGGTGLIVPPRDAAALADAIAKLAADRPLADALGQAARRHAERRFGQARVIRTLRRLQDDDACGREDSESHAARRRSDARPLAAGPADRAIVELSGIAPQADAIAAAAAAVRERLAESDSPSDAAAVFLDPSLLAECGQAGADAVLRAALGDLIEAIHERTGPLGPHRWGWLIEVGDRTDADARLALSAMLDRCERLAEAWNLSPDPILRVCGAAAFPGEFVGRGIETVFADAEIDSAADSAADELSSIGGLRQVAIGDGAAAACGSVLRTFAPAPEQRQPTVATA